MVNPADRTVRALIGVATLLLFMGNPGQIVAADQDKPAKKPKAAPEAKASKPKSEKPKFQSAET